MAVNRGKQFEDKIRSALEKVPDISVDRLPDPAAGYAGIRNICDFIVYRYPFVHYFECKTTHEGTLNWSAFTDDQWTGLQEKDVYPGTIAGAIVWFVKKDRTVFVPIHEMCRLYREGKKSLSLREIDEGTVSFVEVPGRKLRILYDYDGDAFISNLDLKYGERAKPGGDILVKKR